jgi:hypothetical protein
VVESKAGLSVSEVDLLDKQTWRLHVNSVDLVEEFSSCIGGVLSRATCNHSCSLLRWLPFDGGVGVFPPLQQERSEGEEDLEFGTILQI